MEQGKQTDYSFEMRDAIQFTMLCMLVFAIVFVPYYFIWGAQDLWQGVKIFVLKIYISFPVIIVGIILHEFIHFIFLSLLGKINRKDFSFSIEKESLSPYVYCAKPVKLIYYRISGVAPFIILGVLPVIFSLVLGYSFWLLFGYIFMFSAGGDLYMLMKTRNLPNSVLVQDHKERPGCVMVEIE